MEFFRLTKAQNSAKLGLMPFRELSLQQTYLTVAAVGDMTNKDGGVGETFVLTLPLVHEVKSGGLQASIAFSNPLLKTTIHGRKHCCAFD
jgi:hypothetical protein